MRKLLITIAILLANINLRDSYALMNGFGISKVFANDFAYESILEKQVNPVRVSSCGNKIFFNSARWELDDGSLSNPKYANEVLDCWAAKIEGGETVKIKVYGHADKRKFSKGNKALSEFRAKSVSDYLEAKTGLKLEDGIEGLGDGNPNPDCDEEKCWKENRWVEIRNL
ncbi:MAG: OmpA family protein [Candidatus Pacebacteria bacterium]|nr:OmpA family protein [Candidatus Paceibacterota bacterium]